MKSPVHILLPLAALCLWGADARRVGRFLAEGPSAEDRVLSLRPTPSITSNGPAVEAADGPGESTVDAANWLKSDARFKGDGTAFSDAVNGSGAAFACSFHTLNPKFSSYFAAINAAQWEDGAACGRCALARCVDERCPVRGEDVLVSIVDLCPECSDGDLDFSFPAYRSVTGSWPHRLAIEWRWASCASEIDGTLRFHPKDGIDDHWQAFYLSNSRYPIREVRLDGVALQRSPYQFFMHSGPMPEGATLEVTADSGAVVTAVVKSLTEEADLGVQFPAGP